MAKRKFHKVRVRLGDLKSPEAGDLFYTPEDERLVGLCRSALRGEIPTTDTTVPLDELEVHDPPTLDAIRADLMEEPSFHDSLREWMLETPRNSIYKVSSAVPEIVPARG